MTPTSSNSAKKAKRSASVTGVGERRSIPADSVEAFIQQRRINAVQARQPRFRRWFSNLSIRKKQIAALVSSEVISVIGLVGVGAFLLVTSGRTQLLNQAKSELVVMDINYNIKIDQMGFGFRGQSDNAAIIEAAQNASLGQTLNPALRNQVQQILSHETQARKIEYATLVDKNRRIIVNANRDRAGELFDPNNLVSQVLNNPEQIKTSEIVPWADLVKEAPPLFQQLPEQDALVRYTVTPVKDPATGTVLGALLSGDLVNQKQPIIENTLNAFDGGYGAVYQPQPSGEFSLATAFNSASNSSENLQNDSILKKAVATDEVVTKREPIAGEIYTLAAKRITDFQGKPVAVLVRGTPEGPLNTLLGNSLLWQLAIAALALCADILLAIVLGRVIARPMERLRRNAQAFAQGDRLVRAEVRGTDEIGQLASTFNAMADSIEISEEQLRQETARSRLLAEIANTREAQALKAPLTQLIAQVREALNADRVVIYRFNADGSGYIAAESLLPGWPSALGEKFVDPCIPEALLLAYRQGRVVPTRNVFEADFHPDHLELLKRLQIQSNLVTPVLLGEDLYALLIAHHCSNVHDWLPSEIDFLVQFATQIGVALSTVGLLEKRQAEAQRQRQQTEILQQELLQLITSVEGASSGNLTVRAEITAGEIGIVADVFNAVIENLRSLVTKVKQAATQVNVSVEENDEEIRQLAQAAIAQASQIAQSLTAVEQMTHSILQVADNARQAAAVARKASTTAESGGKVMDLTVQNIQQLRETVSETAKKVKRLGEASQQISRVIVLINQIALKTNLLAVNASIEAARAGEEGLGFAVVAEEVGELAAQSATATKEIEQIVETIQLETGEVVQAMELGTNQVVKGTRLVAKTKQSLEQIVQESQHIDQLLQVISQATVSQAQASRSVTALMEKVAQISNQTSDASRQVSHSLRQTVDIAQQLQTSVEPFNVEEQT